MSLLGLIEVLVVLALVVGLLLGRIDAVTAIVIIIVGLVVLALLGALPARIR